MHKVLPMSLHRAHPSPLPAGTIQMGTGGNRGNGGVSKAPVRVEGAHGVHHSVSFPNLKKLVLCCFHTSVPSVASCSVAWFRLRVRGRALDPIHSIPRVDYQIFDVREYALLHVGLSFDCDSHGGSWFSSSGWVGCTNGARILSDIVGSIFRVATVV